MARQKSKSNSIDALVGDLNYLARNLDKLLSGVYDEIFAKIIVEIGKTTAYDTGKARDMLGEVLLDLGYYDLLDEISYEVFEYWKSREARDREPSLSVFERAKTDKGRAYSVTIEDEGFYQQQDGIVSTTHPRNDAEVKPYNVQYVLDTVEAGTNPLIESSINKIVDIIVDVIEKGR